MSIRVQVILKEEEATKFKSLARKESKSLSAWLRDAARKMIELEGQSLPLEKPEDLKAFFDRCNDREKGLESDWDDHKRLIEEGYRAGNPR